MSGFLPPVLPFLGAAGLFGLSCIFRFSCYPGFLERPITVALIWGACSADWETALPLGIFFELFWMDLIGAGTYIPPNSNLPLLLCLFISSVFTPPGAALTSPPLVAIILSIPLAFLATGLEQRHRVRLNSLHEHWVEDRQMDRPIGTAEIALAILRLCLLEMLLFTGLGLILYWLFKLAVSFSGHFPVSENLGWPALWLTAVLGGLLSLRTRRAVVSLAVSLGILSILVLRG